MGNVRKKMRNEECKKAVHGSRTENEFEDERTENVGQKIRRRMLAK